MPPSPQTVVKQLEAELREKELEKDLLRREIEQNKDVAKRMQESWQQKMQDQRVREAIAEEESRRERERLARNPHLSNLNPDSQLEVGGRGKGEGGKNWCCGW